jgi:glucose/arabinose dehydrogenase
MRSSSLPVLRRAVRHRPGRMGRLARLRRDSLYCIFTMRKRSSCPGRDSARVSGARTDLSWPCRPAACLLGLLLTLATAAIANDAYRLRTVAADLDNAEHFACLKDGHFLVVHGRRHLLRVRPQGHVEAVLGGPASLADEGGRWLDVAADRNFDANRIVYLSYAEGPPGANGVSVYRARVDGGRLVGGRRIYRSSPDKATPFNYGGRLLLLDGGLLLITVGDGVIHREAAQSWDSELGKVMRIYTDGTPAGARGPESSDTLRIWARGLRHATAIAADPRDDTIYVIDEGPGGGDEINELEPSGNYGWPAVSHGVDRSGALVTPFRTAPNMLDPIWVWPEAIRPHAMAFYRGQNLPAWRGSLFVAAEKTAGIHRLRLARHDVVEEEQLFLRLDAPVRDLRSCGDDLYLLTGGPAGRLLRVLP